MSNVSVSMPGLSEEVKQVKINAGRLKSSKAATSTGLDLQAAKKFVDGFTKLNSALNDYASLVAKDGDRLLTLGENQTALDKQASK